MTQRLADYWHAGTRAETGTNVKGTTRMSADQIHLRGTGGGPPGEMTAVGSHGFPLASLPVPQGARERSPVPAWIV